MLPREQYALLHHEINATDMMLWHLLPDMMRLREEWAERFGQRYPQECAGNMGSESPWPNMNDLNWNLFLRVIFTRCVLLTTTPETAAAALARPWTPNRLARILARLGLGDINLFCARLWQWIAQNDAAYDSATGRHDDRSLREICRPGAWLLDCVFTEVVIILSNSAPGLLAHLRTRPPTYMVVTNSELRRLATRIFHPREPILQRNQNYVGNVLEHLAWLAFEDNRADLIVAMAYWVGVEW